jgi:hypothetical protein
MCSKYETFCDSRALLTFIHSLSATKQGMAENPVFYFHIKSRNFMDKSFLCVCVCVYVYYNFLSYTFIFCKQFCFVLFLRGRVCYELAVKSQGVA